jgi:ethanolamine ammonia-lyase small subunit
MSNDLWPAIIHRVRLRTPARLLAGRSGGAYRTATHLELRSAHAAARDAVRTEFNLQQHLGRELIERFGIFEVSSQAQSKDQYLLRPDLGRKLSAASTEKVTANCTQGADLQLVIGDGLSTTAVATQVPGLLPILLEMAKQRGWSVGQPFAVRFCRVGILNDVGDLLRAAVVVLLIGERPGLATSESLSAYLAFRPRAGHTDADRNLISNIHRRGVPIEEAATRILNLAGQMMLKRCGGVQVREELPGRVADQLRG